MSTRQVSNKLLMKCLILILTLLFTIETLANNNRNAEQTSKLGIRGRASYIFPGNSHSQGFHIGVTFKRYDGHGFNIQQEFSYWNANKYSGLELTLLSLAYNINLNRYTIEPFFSPLQLDYSSNGTLIGVSYGISTTYRLSESRIIFFQVRKKHAGKFDVGGGGGGAFPIIVGIGIEFSR